MAALSTQELSTYDEEALITYLMELNVVGGKSPILMKNKGLMICLIMKHDESKRMVVSEPKVEETTKETTEETSEETSEDTTDDDFSSVDFEESSEVSFSKFFDTEITDEEIYTGFSPDVSEEKVG